MNFDPKHGPFIRETFAGQWDWKFCCPGVAEPKALREFRAMKEQHLVGLRECRLASMLCCGKCGEYGGCLPSRSFGE